MGIEAYSVAVRLTLTNHMSAGLNLISGHLKATGHDVDALHLKLKEIKRLSMAGAGLSTAGFLGLAMLKVPLQEAKKFQIEVAKFSSLGFGFAINNEAARFASGMNTIGTSARDNMAIVGDAMAVFKDLKEAKMVAPLMAKMKFANEVIFGAGGGDRDKKLMDMMKVAEFRGGTTSPEEFARQANFAQQAIAGSRNRVDPSAMLLALKTGGVALSRRSNEAFYLGAEPLLQEFGGSRYGTGAMSIYQNLVQSRGTITAQQELYRLGLLNPKMVQFNILGKLKKAIPGAFIGSAILEKEGELALLEKVLLPAFAAKGITSDEGIIRELGMILGNRTGSSLLSRIYQQREKLHMQTDANYHAENLDQASARAAGTLQGKEVELHAKWSTLMKDLGITILPLACKAVEGFTYLLKGAISFSERFPTITAGLVGAFGAVSLALVGGGVTLGLTACVKGLAIALPGLTTELGAGSALRLGLLYTGSAIKDLSRVMMAETVTLRAAFLGPLGLVAVVAASAYAIFKIAEAGKKNQFPTHQQQADMAAKHGWGAPTSTTGGTQTFNQPVSPGGNNPTIHIHNTFDGERVTNKVISNMARAADGPLKGVSFVDYLMTPVPVNY